jgi:hypothetical protein
VQGLSIGRVYYKDAMGQPQITEQPYLIAAISIKNLSSTKKIDFETWRGNELGIGSANLTDDNQNNYKRMDLTPAMSFGIGDSYSDSDSIYPQTSFDDRIVFEKPIQNIKWLHLELPAANFGGTGMIRFEISKDKIK